MDYFHHYLVGRRFDLLTDHKPLVPLSRTHTKTLNRLQLKMQEMHPDVGYIPGKDNVVADFLSRYEGVGVSAVTFTAEHFVPQQLEDPLCNSIFRFLAGKPRRQQGHWFPAIKQFVTFTPKGAVAIVPAKRKGIITPEFLVVTPAALRQAVVQEAHNSKIGGHGGAFRTSERIKSTCWWPKMNDEVADHVKNCPVCGASPHSTAQSGAATTPVSYTHLTLPTTPYV